MYNREELNAIARGAMKGKTAAQYVKQGTTELVKLLGGNPKFWQCFGPYWGIVQALLAKHQPDFKMPAEWNNEEPPPDYLSHYDYGDDGLNLVAALQYLNRDGDYLAHPDQPHSIELADGSDALYMPGVGLLSQEDSSDVV